MRKIAILGLMALSPLLLASRITLKNGSNYYGTFESGNSRTITFRDQNGVKRQFNLSDVQMIDFMDQYAPAVSNTANRSESTDGSIPAGTQVSVRTNETIDSNTGTEGRTYSAMITQDVLDGAGRVAIPRGSDAQLVIRNITGGGTVGSPNLVLDMESVTVNGQRYLISTANVKQSSREGIGKNRRTAEMVGGGAVLGTLLGAIAGGGKGAAIGAIAGAAAGGAVQVLTRGKEVKVPAETVLNFQLDQAMRLEPARR